MRTQAQLKQPLDSTGKVSSNNNQSYEDVLKLKTILPFDDQKAFGKFNAEILKDEKLVHKVVSFG